MKVLDLQYQYGMATESKTLNCFQIQIPSICYASEGIRLAILYPLKEKSYHSVGKAHLFIYSYRSPKNACISHLIISLFFVCAWWNTHVDVFFFISIKATLLYIYHQSILTSRKNIVSFSEFLCLKVALKSLWASVWLWLINSTEAGGSITNE